MLIVRKPADGETATSPVWTPVMGAEVLFAPIDRPMLLRARRAARDVIGSAQEGGEVSPDAMIDELGDAFSRALILEGALDWRNVCVMGDADADGVGEPLPFTAENLALAISDPVTFEAFDAAYVVPFVSRERQRAEPGNGSAASPNGTGEAGTQASDTATSAASPRTARAARNARTRSTSRKPKPKKASGAS